MKQHIIFIIIIIGLLNQEDICFSKVKPKNDKNCLFIIASIDKFNITTKEFDVFSNRLITLLKNSNKGQVYFGRRNTKNSSNKKKKIINCFVTKVNQRYIVSLEITDVNSAKSYKVTKSSTSTFNIFIQKTLKSTVKEFLSKI